MFTVYFATQSVLESSGKKKAIVEIKLNLKVMYQTYLGKKNEQQVQSSCVKLTFPSISKSLCQSDKIPIKYKEVVCSCYVTLA